ncbi:hypothetical protein OG500_21665 [Kitasatospora sp. NBC_01250]|uniref:hypothetical protein n=1 Tax=unclassified Kitasatospora TaxID=2633591 RepID=UPI002E147FBA|nr:MULTISPECIES: hypothetical protein [unclassified Kitasatospora]WSJ68663.1 hypothetical protein OG294_22510 [Kitasatospora sp. NBC_01302]
MTVDGSQGPEGAEQPAAADDPFAYLYRPEGGEGESAPERAPGVPRTPYTRPMEVGRAQYGPPASYPPPGGAPYQQQHQQQGGYPPQYQQQRPYGPGPEATTQLPNQQPRYAERSRPQPGDEAPRRRSRGPVIAVVAVVAAIAIGSGIALSGNDGKSTKDNAAPAPAPSAGHSSGGPSSPAGGSSASPSASASPSGSPSASASVGSGTTFLDASTAQGAGTANTVKGAVSSDGSYLTLQQGTTATWTVNVATAGQYTFWLHYNNSGGSTVHVAIGVNGQDHAGGTNFKSWPGSNGDASRSWSYTYIYADLQAGTNTFTVAPAGGPVLLDQAAITAGNGSGSYPAAPGAASPSAS